ncbi:MAG: TPM domain-containing protein [Campylobacterales bacterium]|nr:TPM domain-containing protein [Campylobacterales bacterium]
MKLLKSIILLVLFAVTVLFSAPNFPKLNNSRVVDNAGLFNTYQRIDLEKRLAAHETNTSNQVVVVTLNSLEGYDIADYGYQLGRHWGIGQKDKNNGVLLIVAPNERKVRIEVGYGLEGALPDATANSIIQYEILPFFKTGNYYDGVNSGIKSILEAIKGEYKPVSSDNKDLPMGLLLFPILFIALMFIGAISNMQGSKERIIPAIVSGSIAGIVSWMMFFILGLSVFIAIAVFLLTLLGSNSSGNGSNYYSSSSDFGSSDFGGFSGGGGSFGGGGASGSW